MHIVSHKTTQDDLGRKHHSLAFQEVGEEFFEELATLPHDERYERVKTSMRAVLAIHLHEHGHLRRLIEATEEAKASLVATLKRLSDDFDWEPSIEGHLKALVDEPLEILADAQRIPNGLLRLTRVVYDDLAATDKRAVFKDVVGTVRDPRTGRLEKQKAHVTPGTESMGVSGVGVSASRG